MSPAHRTRQHRWRVVTFVALVLAGVAVVATTYGAAVRQVPASPATLVSAPDAESSAWYCTGQGTAGSVAPGLVVLSNTTNRSVAGTITTVSDTGAAQSAAVAIPARSAVSPSLPAASSGTWQSQIVTLAGGGVAVTQSVHGSSGWSEAPCQSSTSSAWYFAGGTTGTGAGLAVTLLDPTTTPVVVDLSFVTPSGVIHPINYQGVVLQPGQLVVKDVGAEVQNQSNVSTVVSARTGRFVAAELQAFPAPTAGLSVVAGATRAEPDWVIPQAEEGQGGSSEIDVLNPGTTGESVTVHLRLPSGPLAPLSSTVAPGSTWVLTTSSQTRIPAGASYSADVEATGGPGVVVARTVHAPGSAPAPQSGLAAAVDSLSTASPTQQWVVAPPGTSTAPPVAGAAPNSLALTNPSGGEVDYQAFAMSPSGDRPLASGTLAAHATVVVSGSALAAAGLDEIIVRATGPMGVSEDVAPSGGVGVVTMPGLPLSALIGGL
jgi:hypothetical protein